jgi:predicted dehydrogenase
MYPVITRCSSVDEVWKDEEVRSVVIATPVDTHARLARQALERGRHVLVEKPLAASTAEAWEVVELGQDRGLTVMVGHTFLFSPRMEAVCAAIQKGQIGRVHYVTTSRLNLGLYRTDINVIWDLAPHDLSITLQVLDEYPLLVQTTAQCSVRPNVPDVAFISLTFPSGAIASLAVSWRSPRKVRNTVVVGEQGMIVYDDTQPEEPVKIYDRGVVSVESASFGENQLTYRYGDTIAPHVAPTEPLFLELQHFLRCVDQGGPCRSDGWFGLEVVKVLEAADRSWRLGGVPVATEDTARLRRSG